MLKFGRQNASETAGSGARRGAKPNDPAEEVKRKARQRLIGAAILVLTAIIVVPMLLDSEPRPLGQDISITIPSKDTPFAPKLEAGQAANATNEAAGKGETAGKAETAGKETAGKGDASGSAPANVPAASPAAPSPEPAAPSAPPATMSGPSVPPATAMSPKPAAPAPAATPAPKVETAVPADASKHAEAAHKPDDGAKALALLEGKEAATPKPAATGKHYVQVGAFATQEKVRELQARLKAAGVATFTEKVKTSAGERIRLRAGPYGERADAESALGKIKAAGISGAAIVQ